MEGQTEKQTDRQIDRYMSADRQRGERKREREKREREERERRERDGQTDTQRFIDRQTDGNFGLFFLLVATDI